MVSTLVCFAIKEEARAFQRLAAGRRRIQTLVTGMGRRNAESAVREFLKGHVSELVLTCGFAGGLNPELKLGDVLFEIRNRKSEIRNELLVAGAKPGSFFCTDRIATTAAEKQRLRERTGADAVEMESEAIQAVCSERGIPCATVRVISDPAGEDLPLDFNQFAKADLSLDYGKLAWAVAKSPGRIGALLKFQNRCRAAAEKLAQVLVEMLPA